jgi:hypothetical protein
MEREETSTPASFARTAKDAAPRRLAPSKGKGAAAMSAPQGNVLRKDAGLKPGAT